MATGLERTAVSPHTMQAGQIAPQRPSLAQSAMRLMALNPAERANQSYQELKRAYQSYVHKNAVSGSGLNLLVNSGSAAPYGLRYGGDTPARDIPMPKGLGYFGLLKSASGYPMTEFSASENIDGADVQFPLIVPTLTREELDWLLAGNDPTESIYQKAIAYAKMRMQSNLSPFAQQSELRYPVPKE